MEARRTLLHVVTAALLLHLCKEFVVAGFLHPAFYGTVRKGTAIQSNKSVNHGTGDYHYNQQPRGTSFISQVSKRDLEERRQVRPPFQSQPQQWQAPPMQQQQQQQPAAHQQHVVPQTAQQMQNGVKDFDSISTNIKAMTSLLGDVKESLTAQTSDIRWLNQKYREIEKRLDRAEIFNTAISQDVSEMKNSNDNSVSQSRFGPIYGERESDPPTSFSVRDYDEKETNILSKKLDGIKEQMNRLDIAIKVGEVTLSSHMDDVNRRFNSIKSKDTDDSSAVNNNMNQQFNYQQPNNVGYQQQQDHPNNMNNQFNQQQPNNMNQQFNQPQPINMNQQFQQPQLNDMNQQFRQPQPPPFEPIQPIPRNFQEAPFQMGTFRYEGRRPGVSYEIPSARQTIQSQSSANYNNQRQNKSFISSISELELAQRRELFEPVVPMPYLDAPQEYFDDGFDDFYPDEPYDDVDYFDAEFYEY